jgi:N-acetylglutamate synthase-like GNAT family acetyltransferase
MQALTKSSIIRPLNPTLEELKILCKFAKAFADSANAGKFEEKVFLSFIDNMLKSKKGQVFMLEKEGKVVGMLGVYACQVFYNSNLRVQEIFWWVDPEYRNSKDSVKLFNKVEEWAKNIGADEVMVSSTTTMKVNELERFYTKKGFRKMDITYIRSLKNG